MGAYCMCTHNLLTCTNKRVKNEVILPDPSVVGHEERETGIHAGVSYEMSVLHAVGANQFALTICDLVHDVNTDEKNNVQEDIFEHMDIRQTPAGLI